MNKIGTQKIETERCILRRIAPDDYDLLMLCSMQLLGEILNDKFNFL